MANQPAINIVVFRYLPQNACELELENDINNEIKMKLLLSGEAIIGQTCLHDKAFLKFTLLNPTTEASEILPLLNKIKKLGVELTESKWVEAL